MKTLTIDQNPSVADNVLFTLKTTDENNYLIDPYKVESLKIYFVERDFGDTEQKEYNFEIKDNPLLSIVGDLVENSRVVNNLIYNTNLKVGMLVEGDGIKVGTTISFVLSETSIMLSYPASKTIETTSLKFIETSPNSPTYSDTFYYKGVIPVHSVGTNVNPAWLEGTYEDLIKKTTSIGFFEYTWNPIGMREGDYFICWSWVPKIGQGLFSDNIKFNLKSSNFISTTSPAHHTAPGKYETLLDRYLPEMYKTMLTDSDRSPDVLKKFNDSVAQGFTDLEDIGNQIVDLLDSNAVGEYMMTYLSNTLDVKLKSQDPTLWRRQIKEAVPLYKRKGTIGSLKDSFSQAGMKLISLQNFWQITSPFFNQESFFISDSDTFKLSKKPVDVMIENGKIKKEYEDRFKIYLTKNNSKETINVDISKIRVFENEYGESFVQVSDVDFNNCKVGRPSFLCPGDIIRFSYYFNIPSNSLEISVDDHIKNLQLADEREEKTIVDEQSVLTIPLKNWNIRLLSESDPMINSILTKRHPFIKNVVFGKIRTEFPYSENVYNMDEYNGSMRDSLDPCDIDKDFLDSCSYCRSGKFDIDLEVENLSNDRISEAREIISENTPFHSILKTINLYGGQNEFVAPPIEDYEVLIENTNQESVIAGATQLWFYRNKLLNQIDKSNRENPPATPAPGGQLKIRSDMTSKELKFSGRLKFKNEQTVLFSSDLNLADIPISENCYVEVTSGLNVGEYRVTKVGKFLTVSEILEPLNTAPFNFKLYNKLFNYDTEFVIKDDIVELSDNSVSFKDLNISTTPGSCHKVKINISGSYYNFDIKEILPNNKLLLNNTGSLIRGSSDSLPYSILDENLDIIAIKNEDTNSICNIFHSNRSKVRFNNADKMSILNKNNNYVFFTVIGDDYLGYYLCKIIGYSGEEDVLYIDTYDGSNLGLTNLEYRQILLPSSEGYFTHIGLQAVCPTNLEQNLGIVNGKNSTSLIKKESDNFKEDFSILIRETYDDPYITLNSYDNYYFISEIDGATIWLSGLFENFGIEGVEMQVEIYKYTKTNEVIDEDYLGLPQEQFSIDRSGKEIINNVVKDNSGFTNYMSQKEGVSFEITTLDGSKEKGEI
jgi:P2-related tail formation protein